MAEAIVVTMELGNGFDDSLTEEMVDELAIAEKKWGVSLNSDDKRNVMHHSLIQAKRRANTVCGDIWDNTGSLRVTVKGASQSMEINSSKPLSKAAEEVMVIRKRDGFTVAEEDGADTFGLADVPSKVDRLIRDNARTAVFYGVGSYAQ